MRQLLAGLRRSLRWRSAASVATAVLAAVTVLGIVIGPLWTRTGSESILRDTLTSASPDITADQVELHGAPGTSLLAAAQGFTSTHPLAHHGGSVSGLRIASNVGGDLVPLLWRQDECAQITLAAGRCPTAPGEVVLERAMASYLHLPAQGALTFQVYGQTAQGPDIDVTVQVVGVYLPKNPASDYWTGEPGAFEVTVGEDSGNRLPAMLTVPETFDDVSKTLDSPLGFATTTRLLDVGSVRLADVPTLRREVEQEQAAAVAESTGDLSIQALGAVLDPLAASEADGHRLAVASRLVVAQLVLLSVVVLLLAVSSSASARAPEVAAARLRGLRTGYVVWLSVAEPVVLVLLAVPVGALGAWGVVHAMSAARLVDGTPVVVSGQTVLALVGGLVAVLVGVLLTCRRVLGRPVLELWQRTQRPPGALVLALELLVVTAGIAVAVAVPLVGGSITLLLPLPVSLVLALLGLRLLPVAARPWLRRSRARRRVAGFLAVRQLVRRREGALLVGLLVVAFGLAGTATTTWSVGRRAAALRGDTEVGAPRVLRVQADVAHPDLDLRAAVRKADPSGKEAMAVQEYYPFSGDPGGRLIAVDSSRLAAVSSWDTGVVGASSASVAAVLGRPARGGLPWTVITQQVHEDPASSSAPQTPVGGALITTVGGAQRPALVGEVVRTLPRALGDGTIEDWQATTTVPLVERVSFQEVWLGPHATPALLGRLRTAGVTVVSTESAAQRRALLTREGPALAILLSLVAAGLALALSAATVLFQVLTSARRRGYELASLSAVGVPASTLRRATRLETGLVLLLGLGVGTGAAALASTFALPYVPLFSSTDGAVRAPLAPGPFAVGGLVVVGLLLAAVVSTAVGRVLQRATDPARLREVQA